MLTIEQYFEVLFKGHTGGLEFVSYSLMNPKLFTIFIIIFFLFIIIILLILFIILFYKSINKNKELKVKKNSLPLLIKSKKTKIALIKPKKTKKITLNKTKVKRKIKK